MGGMKWFMGRGGRVSVVAVVSIALGNFMGYSQSALRMVVRDDDATRAIIIRGGSSASPLYFTIGSPNARIIKSPASSANFNSGFMLEREAPKIRWYLSTGTTADTFEVPYVRFKKGNTSCPDPTCLLLFHVKVSGAGTEVAGSKGYIDFTTWTDTAWSNTSGGGCCPSWDNWTYKPSDVTHMCGWPQFNLCLSTVSNNSGFVVDRFWVIGAGNYTAKPTLSEIKFSYLDDDELEVGANNNTQLDEADLIAQRFNSSSGKWLDWVPPVIARDAALNYVKVGPVDGANLFRSWTLSDQTNPLPITYTILEGMCGDNHIALYYEVFSPEPSSRINLLFSRDGLNYSQFATLYTSSGDYKVEGGVAGYYRLEAYDMDGNITGEKTIYVSCDESSPSVLIEKVGDELVFVFKGKGPYTAMLFDNSGKKIFAKEGDNEEINTIRVRFDEIPAGSYMAFASISSTQRLKRIVIIR